MKSYTEFILESYLISSNWLLEILKDISGDRISKEFLNLIDKDIITKYNALNITDKNDKISFISDNQFNTKVKSGINPIDLFSDDNNKTSIGRIVRGILRDNGVEFTDYEISKFVDRFKAGYQKYHYKKLNKSPIRIVEGDEIAFWYNEKNYSKETIDGKGTLGRSCMRYESCKDYFNIYKDNPKVCRLIILTKTLNDKQVLMARSLIWKTSEGVYLDRVYFTDQSEVEIIRDWAKEKEGATYFYNSSVPKMSVDLQVKKAYKKYPYMDSFQFLYNDETLYNYTPNGKNDSKLTIMIDTSGESEHSVWSVYKQVWIKKNESIWSEYLKSYLFKPDAVLVSLDEEGNEGYLPYDHEDVFFDKFKEKYYLKELTEELEGKRYHKSSLIEVYKVHPSSYEDFKRILFIEKLESEPFVTMTFSDFFKIKREGKSKKISKDEYWKNYKMVSYESFIKDLQHSEEMSKEFKEADDYLMTWDDWYINHNRLIEKGGLKKAMRDFLKRKPLIDSNHLTYLIGYEDRLSMSQIDEFDKIIEVSNYILYKRCVEFIIDYGNSINLEKWNSTFEELTDFYPIKNKTKSEKIKIFMEVVYKSIEKLFNRNSLSHLRYFLFSAKELPNDFKDF